MKTKLEIKSIWGKVIFTHEGETLKDALVEAVKSRADLYGANLYGANLSRANLYGAKDIPTIAAARTSIVPESGYFYGWKKCKHGVLVQLVIGKTAKRSNATGRKCRAEHVKVIQVVGGEVGISIHDGTTQYRVGQIVRCDVWSEDRWSECGGGIHFYLTREEAQAHE